VTLVEVCMLLVALGTWVRVIFDYLRWRNDCR